MDEIRCPEDECVDYYGESYELKSRYWVAERHWDWHNRSSVKDWFACLAALLIMGWEWITRRPHLQCPRCKNVYRIYP